MLPTARHPVLGIEPLFDSAKLAEHERGVLTVVSFSPTTGKPLEVSKSLPTSSSLTTYSSLFQTSDFVDALHTLLKPEGLLSSRCP